MRSFYIWAFLSVALACEHKGKTYKDGDEFIDGEVFKVRCIVEPEGRWRLSVVECVSSNGIAVPVCDERTVDGRIYQCKKYVNGSVDFIQRDDTETPCDGHPYGSLWKEDSLQFGCGKGGIKDFMGCITSSGMFIPSGEVKWVDGVKIECKRHANGTIMMHVLDRLTSTTCRDYNGKERSEGSEWEHESLRYRCGEGGVVEFMDCLTTSGVLIPVGEVKFVDGFNIQCEKEENGAVAMKIVGKSQ